MELFAKYGTTYQKDRYLKPLLNGEIRSAFLMTEKVFHHLMLSIFLQVLSRIRMEITCSMVSNGLLQVQEIQDVPSGW